MFLSMVLMWGGLPLHALKSFILMHIIEFQFAHHDAAREHSKAQSGGCSQCWGLLLTQTVCRMVPDGPQTHAALQDVIQGG
jgi:hypothetical protein